MGKTTVFGVWVEARGVATKPLQASLSALHVQSWKKQHPLCNFVSLHLTLRSSGGLYIAASRFEGDVLMLRTRAFMTQTSIVPRPGSVMSVSREHYEEIRSTGRTVRTAIFHDSRTTHARFCRPFRENHMFYTR